MGSGHIIMDEQAMQRAIARISYEIIEHNKGADDICIVGILSRGAPLGRRIAAKLSELENVEVPFGELDITPYRDDIRPDGHTERTDIPFDILDKNVIIVDDVIFDRRTDKAWKTKEHTACRSYRQGPQGAPYKTGLCGEKSSHLPQREGEGISFGA